MRLQPVRVMVATKPVDFCKGADGLAALVSETMKANPFSGTIYVFRAIKLIFWVEDGKFRWPGLQDGVIGAGPVCLDSAPQRLSGFLPGYAEWLNAGLCDFAVASGGRSPTRAANSDDCWIYLGAGSASKATAIMLGRGEFYRRYCPYDPNDEVQERCATTDDSMSVIS